MYSSCNFITYSLLMETESNCKLWWALEKLVSTGVNNGRMNLHRAAKEGISDKMP